MRSAIFVRVIVLSVTDPSAPEAFKPYLTWTSRKAPETKPRKK